MRQPDGLPHHLQEEGQRHGDEAAAAGHDAVGQAKAALEVVAEDDQRGLEGEGAAAAKEDAIGEVTDLQRPGGKKTSRWSRHRDGRKPCHPLQALESRPRARMPPVLHRQAGLEELIPQPKRGLSSLHSWHIKTSGKMKSGWGVLSAQRRRQQPTCLPRKADLT